jgi:hypothetical protein
MISFESVLAFGDSNVAGCELAKPLDETFRTRAYKIGKVTAEELDAEGKVLAFPQRVADHFNVPCYNYAMTGGTNARSLRLLTQAVVEHPNSLVLFGYGTTDRMEFYYPDGGMGCDKDKFFQAGINNFDMHLNRKYLEIYHPYNNLKQLMFCVDAICRIHANNFFHVPIFAYDNADEIPDVPNLIDWGNDAKNCEVWAMKNNFVKFEFHYGIDFHEAIADLIIQNLIKGKLC